MTCATKALYVTSLRGVQALAANFQPSRVMADYEDGFIVALKEQGAYNSGKPGKLREFFNSGKLREFYNLLREFW